MSSFQLPVLLLSILLYSFNGFGVFCASVPRESSAFFVTVENEPPKVEQSGRHWIKEAQTLLHKKLTTELNKNRAKNVIFFLGDGMSIATLAATRVYLGNENVQLSFEEFPYTGLSKTYCTNTQVSDSSCTATAYLSGVKANFGTTGVTAAVVQTDCMAENNTANHVDSIIAWAQAEGKATGVVTNTEITGATPSGAYCHTANRYWENDQLLLIHGGDPKYCTDIAKQLIYGEVGRNLNVTMGGGRQHFLKAAETDIDGFQGQRMDGMNLLDEWQRLHNKTGIFVDTRSKLEGIDLEKQQFNHIFGLFSAGKMPYHLEGVAERPTVEEMTMKAMDVLERQKEGYVLFVESGLIDYAHHDAQAQRALDETAELHKAVKAARERTSEEDTLIVVTSDHAHTMTMSGYPSRGNDILGLNDLQRDQNDKHYATLSYANGPGLSELLDEAGVYKDLRTVDMHQQTFKYPSTVPMDYETHGGDDVAVFASGPWAHLFSGNYEQNFIPHAIGYAACLGSGLTMCQDKVGAN